MKLRHAPWLVLLVLFTCANFAWAQEPLYVTDQIRVTVRTGPGLDKRIFHSLKSGDKVTLLERAEDGWGRVKLADGREGWMMHRYLIPEKPAVLRLQELDPKTNDLSQEVSKLREANRELKAGLKEAQSRVADLSSRYSALQAQSAEVIKLSKEHKELKTRTEEQARQLEELNSEAQSLRFSSNLKWFLAGAGVLVLGWLLGWALGRRRRRWSSSLY